jgi:hypothetical protein
MPRRVVDYQVPLNTVGYRPLAGWEYERVPEGYGAGAVVSIMATGEIAHALQMSVKTGSTSIMDQGILSLDAVPGHLPVDTLVQPLKFRAQPGDLVGVSIDELLGAATYLQFICDIEPVVV